MNSNPYFPASSDVLSSNPQHVLQASLVACAGAMLGIVSFYIALIFTPRDVASIDEFNTLFHCRFGFTFSCLIGLWCGYLQRSRRMMILGLALGVCSGIVYINLSQLFPNHSAWTIPTLLTAITMAVAGIFIKGAPELIQRFARGLVAGFLFEIIFSFLLDEIGIYTTPDLVVARSVEQLTVLYWRIGPWAIGGASACYLVLVHWACGLSVVQSAIEPSSEKTLDQKLTVRLHAGPTNDTFPDTIDITRQKLDE